MEKADSFEIPLGYLWVTVLVLVWKRLPSIPYWFPGSRTG